MQFKYHAPPYPSLATDLIIMRKILLVMRNLILLQKFRMEFRCFSSNGRSLLWFSDVSVERKRLRAFKTSEKWASLNVHKWSSMCVKTVGRSRCQRSLPTQTCSNSRRAKREAPSATFSILATPGFPAVIYKCKKSDLSLTIWDY